MFPDKVVEIYLYSLEWCPIFWPRYKKLLNKDVCKFGALIDGCSCRCNDPTGGHGR